MSAILKFWFPKKKTITFFWSKLSKLHKKDPILYVTATFSLKQGETRTNSVGPIHSTPVKIAMVKMTNLGSREPFLSWSSMPADIEI